MTCLQINASLISTVHVDLKWRTGKDGFQGVQATENPSDDFIQEKIMELLNNPEVTDIKVTSYSFGWEPWPPNQGGFPY